MRATKVGKQLAMDHARISSEATLDGIHVQQDLSMLWAVFRRGVNLRGAYIGGSMNIGHSPTDCVGMNPLSIDLDTVIVKGHKYIRNAYIGGEVHLRGAHIYGSVEIVQAIFAQSAIMDEIKVKKLFAYAIKLSSKVHSNCILRILAPILT
jgi:hypothetical protein